MQPSAVSIRHGCAPGGDVLLWTNGEHTPKGRTLKRAGAFSLVVQNENSPHGHVSVSGPITSWEAATAEEACTVVGRYLSERRRRNSSRCSTRGT